ncbi:restriction endonuclease subunit S [Streptosporangium sp. NPDC001559]|uniref:restriction endonuclease subunit S n=1 Tax=Streptosporangium sp. NPDC001559 TaxID=3366187 RepID=UPI0036ECAEB4
MTYRIKDVALVNQNTLAENTDPEFRFRYIDIGSVNSIGKIEVPDEDLAFAVAPSRARRLAPPGAVIVSTVRTYLRAIASVPETSDPLVFSTGFTVLEAKECINSRFLSYYCQSQRFIDEIVARSVGVSYPAINPSEISVLPISLPRIDEQRRIVDFLDVETTRISRLMSLRKRQFGAISTLLFTTAKELTGRSSILGRSRDPGNQYVQLRRALSSIQTGLTPSGLQTKRIAGTIPWYTPAALNDMLTVGEADKFIEQNRTDVPIFDAGSIIITGIGESLGKVGYLHHPATGNQQLTSLKPGDNIVGRFIAWQLWASTPELREWAQYSRIRILNNEKLKEFPIYLPDRSAQAAIAERLDRLLETIAILQLRMQAFQSLMGERRQALITAAVTGKFDVSSASGRGVEE